MQYPHPFNFQYTYLSLPPTFYTKVAPSVFHSPQLYALNKALCNDLDLSPDALTEWVNHLHETSFNQSFAQAYAGHQFGYFARLGDGRAIVLGEHKTPKGSSYDIQLKGAGRTLYSRGGDGKATLKAMLREYIISEAMFALHISSSRSLALVKTGEYVSREMLHEGAALFRVMKSHIRVGTFEYAAQLASTDDLRALTQYTIQRLYPEILSEANPVLNLLHRVIDIQINLVIAWMRVGFIHGVMNTDNTSISGETFDYGPCAFLNVYDPAQVFSSIDQQGRYAFGNQPNIIQWNLARFAEALIPLLHENETEAIRIAQEAINGANTLWQDRYYEMMLKKMGIGSTNKKLYSLVDEWLNLMYKHQLDYTNTFFELSDACSGKFPLPDSDDFKNWLSDWRYIIENTCGMDQAQKIMKENNPVFIPRNHRVEQAIQEAVEGDTRAFHQLLNVVSAPYSYNEQYADFMLPPDEAFNKAFKTYCGT